MYTPNTCILNPCTCVTLEVLSMYMDLEYKCSACTWIGYKCSPCTRMTTTSVRTCTHLVPAVGSCVWAPEMTGELLCSHQRRVITPFWVTHLVTSHSRVDSVESQLTQAEVRLTLVIRFLSVSRKQMLRMGRTTRVSREVSRHRNTNLQLCVRCALSKNVFRLGYTYKLQGGTTSVS